jgi:long-chain acyl-CoA synthetase
VPDPRSHNTSIDQFDTQCVPVGDAIYTVFKHAPTNLGRFYREAVTRHRDSTYFVYRDERYRFGDAWLLVERVAQALIRTGVSPGDRVGIAMRNYPEWAWVFMAATTIGAVAVCFNSWWSGKELEYGVRDSGVRALFVDQERLERVAPWIGSTGVTPVAVRSDPSDGAIIWSDFLGPDRAPAGMNLGDGVESEHPATILYTSGSSDRAKGVLSTHRALIHAVMGYEYGSVMAAQKQKGDGKPSGAAPPPYMPALLITAPLFHVTGLNSQLLLSLRLGRKIVAMHKWDAEQALAAIEQERITHFSGVPTMVAELMKSPNYAQHDLSSLEAITGGGSAMTAQHTNRISKRSGGRISSRTGYAMTETNGIAASHGGPSLLKRPSSVGRAQPPLVSIKVVDSTGLPLGALEEGEILIHGAMNCSGYWNRPEDTARTLRGGWIYTGDLGYLDSQGYLFITGRIKDLVVRGGEKISCFEVEAALTQHADVVDCVVFGVPDERLGERVACICELPAGSALSAKALKAFLAPVLAAYKVPEVFYLQTTPLARLASGKVDRLTAKASVAAPGNAASDGVA